MFNGDIHEAQKKLKAFRNKKYKRKKNRNHITSIVISAGDEKVSIDS
jgi:hypothetical protein